MLQYRLPDDEQNTIGKSVPLQISHQAQQHEEAALSTHRSVQLDTNCVPSSHDSLILVDSPHSQVLVRHVGPGVLVHSIQCINPSHDVTETWLPVTILIGDRVLAVQSEWVHQRKAAEVMGMISDAVSSPPQSMVRLRMARQLGMSLREYNVTVSLGSQSHKGKSEKAGTVSEVANRQPGEDILVLHTGRSALGTRQSATGCCHVRRKKANVVKPVTSSLVATCQSQGTVHERDGMCLELSFIYCTTQGKEDLKMDLASVTVLNVKGNRIEFVCEDSQCLWLYDVSNGIAGRIQKMLNQLLQAKASKDSVHPAETQFVNLQQGVLTETVGFTAQPESPSTDLGQTPSTQTSSVPPADQTGIQSTPLKTKQEPIVPLSGSPELSFEIPLYESSVAQADMVRHERQAQLGHLAISVLPDIPAYQMINLEPFPPLPKSTGIDAQPGRTAINGRMQFSTGDFPLELHPNRSGNNNRKQISVDLVPQPMQQQSIVTTTPHSPPKSELNTSEEMSPSDFPSDPLPSDDASISRNQSNNLSDRLESMANASMTSIPSSLNMKPSILSLHPVSHLSPDPEVSPFTRDFSIQSVPLRTNRLNLNSPWRTNLMRRIDPSTTANGSKRSSLVEPDVLDGVLEMIRRNGNSDFVPDDLMSDQMIVL